MRRLCDWILPLAATVAAIALLWGTTAPLGVPGEWEWSRHEQGHSLFLTFAPLAITAGCYLGYVWLGLRRLRACGNWECRAWVVGLALAGFAWLWQAQEAAPNGYQLSKAAWVLYFPGPSGYFTEARGDNRPVREFLATYEQRMSQGDVLHIGTHPPGLILVFRGLLSLCRSSPTIVRLLIDSQPESVRSSFDELARTTTAIHELFTETDRAVLWLAALCAQAVAAMTVWPLFGLLRGERDRQASWLGAAFWPAVPAVAIFLPKSDAFFPCPATLILWLWISGFQERSRLRVFLAGVTFWIGLMLSLAFLPIALIAAVHSAWTIWCESPEQGRRKLLRNLLLDLLIAGSGFFLLCLLCWLTSGMNLPAVWWLNFRNHAGFYDQFTRSWWKWLLVNPMELAFAAGAPVVVLAACGMFRQLRLWRRPSNAAAVAWLVVWGLLWLSGKNMGEAARLWIFLIPGLLWIGVSDLASANLPDPSERVDFRRAGFLLVLQFVLCAATVTRVVGFHFS